MPAAKLLVSGCLGRMGQTIIDCASRDPDVTIGARIDINDSLLANLPGCDVAIDFSVPAFTRELVRGCTELGKPLVLGTTGHGEGELRFIRQASASLPIVFAPNFSAGVNALFWLTRKAAEILGPGFDLEVVEMHHRMKHDAPSGTARKLAEILAELRELEYAEAARHGRQGLPGPRTDSEIGVHALRGGSVVGDHTVVFAGAGERLELTHRAASRETFALGAIRAAKWLRKQKPGLYDMMDVLGLAP
jgi:4-hydroxy-tetrahydrodipicolinate reductase